MIQSMFLSAMGWLLDGIFWNRNNAQFGKLILNEGWRAQSTFTMEKAPFL
jgi:hypothetical protein